jgi:hypothetical protein
MEHENLNNQESAQLGIGAVSRRAFDVERRPNGDFFIYTFYWDDMGEKVWCANSITETELRRIADGINKFL